jgi:sugar lactone lactonase YvrE
MKRTRIRFAGWSRVLLPTALLALVFQTGATVTAAPAGTFPDFVPLPGMTPRGVAVDKVGNVFVSVGQGSGPSEHVLIWEFTPYGEGPAFVADVGQGTIGGLMAAADGDLYVALAAGLDRGVWRVAKAGQVELLPGSNQIFFANGLAFDERGTLYVSESVSLSVVVGGKPAGPGSIWRIPRGGEAELWMRDEVLRGTGALGQPVWLGANGIAYYHGNLYVTNTEKGTVIRIPVLQDGSAGLPDVWALQPVPESPMPLPPMGDGIALDVHGNLYVAVLTKSAVVRINAQDLSQETIAAFQIAPNPVPNVPLDFPASLFFGTGKDERTSLFVTNMGMGRVVAPPLPWAGPGLVKIDAGMPGDPLH